jgi:hypothetical protein
MTVNFRTENIEVRGTENMQAVAAYLLNCSAWFQVEPCPNDWWLVTVKPERVQSLGDLAGVFIERIES